MRTPFASSIPRAAVADGASDAAFAREWAKTLVDAFVSAPPEPDDLDDDALATWLAPPQQAWHDAVPWDRIPWHGEAKARAGAFATLVGLTIGAAPNDPAALRWRAMAVGDSCLFVVRGDDLAVSFPVDDAAQFDNNPRVAVQQPRQLRERGRLAETGQRQLRAGRPAHPGVRRAGRLVFGPARLRRTALGTRSPR